jgi:hypothetical protein
VGKLEVCRDARVGREPLQRIFLEANIELNPAFSRTGLYIQKSLAHVVSRKLKIPT